MTLFEQLKNYPSLEQYLSPFDPHGVYSLMESQMPEDIDLTNLEHIRQIHDYADCDYDICMRYEASSDPEEQEYMASLLSEYNGVDAENFQEHKDYMQRVLDELEQIEQQIMTDPAATSNA